MVSEYFYNKESLAIDVEKLQVMLKYMKWNELKEMLKETEEMEQYEVSRMIQNEIDERVKAYSVDK